MNSRNWLYTVLPPPARPVGLRQALPLVLFVVAYVILCVALEWTDTVLFARPWAFALMALSAWVCWMYAAGQSGLSPLRGLMALQVRLAMLGLLVMLLAEPRAVRTDDSLSVVFALDLSDSIGEATTDRAVEFVLGTVGNKPAKDEVGLVVFGRNAAVELPPRASFPFEAINSQIDRDGTNLEQGLSLAAAMLPEEKQGRIVLVSDGSQTTGDLADVLDQLKSRGVAVDVLPVEYAYEHEVWLERLELPRTVKLGENYEAAVILSSLADGSGKLTLRENGEEVYSEEVDFTAGKNRFVIPVHLRKPGYYEYSAAIHLPEGRDHLKQNNTVMNYLFVEGKGRVLVVTDPDGDPRDWEAMVLAMREGQRSVDIQSAYDFSRDMLSLMPYDCVVFHNVAADMFDAVQLNSLRDAVYHQGIGFVMVGGENSFGPGGYHRTAVEEALPVTMDITKKKILPKGALAIILHTCEFPEGNTWGKRITKQAIRVLGSQDEVGVLVFAWEGGEKWLFPLTPASEYEKLVPKINGAQIGDMPSFQSTMELGLEGLKASDAATKHMIIISDGDPSPPTPALIKQYVDNKISITTVAIFPHGGEDISKMRAVAEMTGGRYRFPQDPNELPSIFVKEAKTLRRSMIQNRTITPEMAFPSPVMKGIETIPEVKGYVLTTAKDRAKTVLRVPLEESDEQQVDPILATWRFGLATTAAFTSDLSTNWCADWVTWDRYRAFIKQLLTDVARVRRPGHLHLWTLNTASEGTIVVEDFHPDEAFLDVRARVTGPREQSETIQLEQVSARRYQANIDLWGKGRYHVIVEASAGDRKDFAHGGMIVSYSPEYLRFRSKPQTLAEVRQLTGGELLDPETAKETIYERREPKQSSRPIFDWFLVALACLLPLDVGLRRIHIDFRAIAGRLGFGGKRHAPTETMGALLRRKETVRSEMESKQGDVPPAVDYRDEAAAASPTAPSTTPETPPPKQEAQEDTPSDERRTTTQRLLDIKRGKK